jgi:hypothetical protein
MAALLLYRPVGLALLSLAAALPLICFGVLAADVLPRLDQLWLSRSAAALVARYPAPEQSPLVVVGYSEPSLVFLLGTDLRLVTTDTAADMLAPGGEALVADRQDGEFRRDAARRGLALDRLGAASGIDYSNGQRRVLTLYAVRRG